MRFSKRYILKVGFDNIQLIGKSEALGQEKSYSNCISLRYSIRDLQLLLDIFLKFNFTF